MEFDAVLDTSDAVGAGPADVTRPGPPTIEANAETDAALDDAFAPGPGTDIPADVDQALDDVFPAEEPGGLDYEPSPTGVHYPDPERMEGNVGGPERGG